MSGPLWGYMICQYVGMPFCNMPTYRETFGQHAKSFVVGDLLFTFIIITIIIILLCLLKVGKL